MKTIARQFADFTAGTRFSSLPKETVHELKRRILDSLGCAFAALDAPPVKAAAALAARARERPGATVLGFGFSTTPELACFANGVMVRYLDYNDTYLSKEPAHPSDNLAPALALAEALGRGGRDLLAALAVAYEIQCRLCDAAGLRPRGWDHVTYGAFSSAAAAAGLLGLSREKTVHALSLAGAANIALRQTRVGELSHWKACAFANAARNGVFAARLAAAGVTGPEKIFEGEKGFFKLVSGPFRLPPLKRPSMIHKTHIKFFPVEYHAQSAVEAALRLRARTPEAARAVSVAVDTFEAAVDIIGRDREKWRPRSRETADHSLPYCVAAALSDGKMGPAQFSPRRLRDRRLLALVQKVRVREDKALTRDYPAFLPCRLTVRTAGGKTLTEYVRAPRGHAKNPMSDGEVEEKFRRLAGPRLPMKRMEQVVETVWGLERVARMDALMRLLRAS